MKSVDVDIAKEERLCQFLREWSEFSAREKAKEEEGLEKELGSPSEDHDKVATSRRRIGRADDRVRATQVEIAKRGVKIAEITQKRDKLK